MPPDIFGAPVGIMSVDQDQRDRAQSMMILAQGAQKLELGQMELSKQRNLMQALAQKGLIGNQSGGASGLKGATQHDLASDLFTYADAAVSTGNLEEAAKASTSASTLLKNASQIQKTTFDTNLKRLNVMGGLMDGVYDEATWRRANAEYQAQTGEPSPYAKYPFNPDLVQKIKSGVISAKDKAYIGNQQSLEKLHQVEAQKNRYEIGRIAAQTKHIQDQDAILLKNGGKPPTDKELEPVTDMIAEEYGKTLSKEARRTLARPIFSRAKEIMDQEGKTHDEAVNQAYEEAKSSGGLRNISPEAKPKDKALDLIDYIQGQLIADKKNRIPITGVGGFARRADETIRGNLGIMDDKTPAHDYQESLSTLRLLAPKLITGASKSAKDEREMIRIVASGLEPGASRKSAMNALTQLRRFLSGEPMAPGNKPGKPSDDKYTVGQLYRDNQGNTAIYRGSGQWEPQ